MARVHVQDNQTVGASTKAETSPRIFNKEVLYLVRRGRESEKSSSERGGHIVHEYSIKIND